MSVTWQQICESLQSFDRTATLQTVRQFLNAELLSVRLDCPHNELLHVRQDEIWLLVKKLQPLLAQTAGVWYGAGELMVGDEILTGWCWCHSFPSSLEAPTRSQQVQQGAIAILDQLEQRRDYLLKLCKFFDSLPLSTDLNYQEAQMQEATSEIVDFIVFETRCNDSWYRYITPAIAWFLESKEVAASDALRSHIQETIYSSFTSWGSPSPRTQRDISETIAFELLRQEFDRQYPS